MQSFPIDQLSRFYSVFKFSEDVEALISPTTLAILTGQRVSQRVSCGENYFSMQYGATPTTSFTIEEKDSNGRKLALVIPVVSNLNDIMNGYENIQSFEFLREPGLPDSQFIKKLLGHAHEDNKLFDEHYADLIDKHYVDLIKEANDLENSTINALKRLKDYESGNLLIGINNYFGFYIEKSVVVVTKSSSFKLCQFGKVPVDDQFSSKPIRKGFNFVNKNVIMNVETFSYVNYKFDQPVRISR